MSVRGRGGAVEGHREISLSVPSAMTSGTSSYREVKPKSSNETRRKRRSGRTETMQLPPQQSPYPAMNAAAQRPMGSVNSDWTST